MSQLYLDLLLGPEIVLIDGFQPAHVVMCVGYQMDVELIRDPARSLLSILRNGRSYISRSCGDPALGTCLLLDVL